MLIFTLTAHSQFINVLFRLYYPTFNVTLTQDTLCAGSDFTGTSTQGDWGTPLMVSTNNIWFATGVYSFYVNSQSQKIFPQSKSGWAYNIRLAKSSCHFFYKF